jgi:dethiobiotin synthetase
MLGLFITGTDTGVGKTHVAAIVVRQLAAAGRRVGVYKPAASGCFMHGDQLVSDDAVTLWDAAGRPGTLEAVCPQRFTAPLAPHLAARAEGRELDAALLRRGLDAWRDCDVVVVEGAGGLMSPLGDTEYVADLAHDFGFPLVVVSRNVLGTINQTLQTLIAAAAYRAGPLAVAGIVLNHPAAPSADDASLATNREEVDRHSGRRVLAGVEFGGDAFDRSVDWFALAGPRR